MNWITPMEPVSIPQVKQGKDFVHEIKWDGIRGMVYLEAGSMRIFTKKGNERTEFYPELDLLEKELGTGQVVLDGELVVLDATGQPSFHNVLVRETVKSKRNLQYYLRNYPVKYMMFDILMSNGQLLTNKFLSERKKILEEVVSSLVAASDTFYISQAYDNGEELYELMKQKNMEGIVSKKLNSFYLPGKKHEEWFKTKFTKKMLCIIGGIIWKEKLPNSLLMGVRTGESSKLVYMGRASLGLKGSDLLLLRQYKNDLVQEDCPFELEAITDVSKSGMELTWTVPAITCWVGFQELSNDGVFRHPKILGFTNLPVNEANGKVLTD